LPFFIENAGATANALIQSRECHELKDIAKCLPSLPWSHEDTELASFVDVRIRELNEHREYKMVSEDALFEATRHHLYRRAYSEGSGDSITEDYVQVLLETENQLLARPKGRGDIRSKAKNMARYMQNVFVVYDDRRGYSDWDNETKSKYMKSYRRKKGVTKQDSKAHLREVKQKKSDKIKEDMDILFKEDYDSCIFESTGDFNFSYIAKKIGIHRKTAKRIIRNIQSS
jgi:hypothetical protein